FRGPLGWGCCHRRRRRTRVPRRVSFLTDTGPQQVRQPHTNEAHLQWSRHHRMRSKMNTSACSGAKLETYRNLAFSPGFSPNLAATAASSVTVPTALPSSVWLSTVTPGADPTPADRTNGIVGLIPASRSPPADATPSAV